MMNFAAVLFSFLFSLSLFASTELLLDQDYHKRLMQELDHAESSIDVLAFSFAIDNGKGQLDPKNPAFIIAQKLIDLKKEKGAKLRIRLYIEGERNTIDRNKITGDFLEKAGIEVKYGSTHAKGFSINHKKIIFGSTNLTTQSMTKNNETNIVSDETDVVTGFDSFFESLWNKGNHGSLKLPLPMLADGDYKSSLLNAINDATTSISFSIYYFNDAELELALINAHKRGIKIQGYLNSKKIPGSDLVEKNVLTVDRLKSAGITGLYFAKDDAFTHSKFLIKDQEEIFIGTGNWNYSDVALYRQLYVQLADPQMARKLSDHLEIQIKDESFPGL